MILGFKTHINGKPTFFVEKIHKSFSIKEVNMQAGIDPTLHYTKHYNYVAKDKLNAKIHTIREDKTDRWQPGTIIDFFINVRTKDMFRFAPRIAVVSIQKITVLWYRSDCNAFIDYKYKYNNRNIRVYIDGNALKKEAIEELAINDGFHSIDDFCEFFNDNFGGKIIHWTDKKY